MYDLAQARHEAVGVKATTSGATSHLNTSVNAKVDRRPLTVLEDIHRQSVQDLVFGPDGRQMIWLSVESPVIKVWNVVAAIQANLGTSSASHAWYSLVQPGTGLYTGYRGHISPLVVGAAPHLCDACTRPTRS